jgi:outer membrane receptor protein involved in Fe transport
VLRVFFSGRTALRLTGDFSHSNPVPLFYAKELAVKPGFTVDNPSDLHHVRTSTPAESRRVQYGGSAQFSWRPAPSTVLTSLFAARKLDYVLFIDSDSTELNLSSASVHEIHDQISEEVTFASERASFTWTGGLFLFRDVDRRPTATNFLATGLANQLSPTVRTTLIAASGQGTIPLGSRLSGIVGLRHTREDKRIQQQRSCSLVFANITIRPRPHWSVGVYARNVTDTDYITGTLGNLLPAIAGRPGEPRQVGVQLTLAMTTDRPRAWTEEQNVRR